MSLSKVADILAAQGRYGDTELVHMNPLEILAMEQISGQKLTRNPATGQREAFAWIPFLMLLANIGSAAATGVAAVKASKNTAAEAEKYQKEREERLKKEMQQRGFPLIQVQSTQAKPNLLGYQQNHFTQVDPIQGSNLGSVDGYAEGGHLEPDADDFGGPSDNDADNEPEEQQRDAIYAAALDAIQGNHENPRGAFDAFIATYGPDALQGLAGGGMVRGPGSGMDDMVTGSIDGRQKVLLSTDEYVVPADVVSALGDGSSTAGARQLGAMIHRVRQQKTGKTKQPGKINMKKVMPR